MEEALGVVAFAASYLGFALLALRQAPHYAAVAGVRRARAAAHRSRDYLRLGAGALALSLGACQLSRGPSFGSILWVLLLGAGAFGVMFTLTYRPHWLRPLLGPPMPHPSAPGVGESER